MDTGAFESIGIESLEKATMWTQEVYEDSWCHIGDIDVNKYKIKLDI